MLPIAAMAGSALLGYLGQRESNQANREATELSAESQRPQLWPQASPYVDQIMGDARNLYGQGGFAPQANQLQLLGRQNQLGYAQGAMPQLISQAQNSWLGGLNQGMDPTVGNMIQSAQNDLVQDYQRNVMPTIGSNAARTGNYGGARHGVAQGIASEGLMESLGDTSVSLLNNAYNQQLAQQRAAWSQAPGMVNLGMMPSQIQQDVGRQYQADMLQPSRNLTGYAQAVGPWTGLTQTNGVNYPAQYSPMWGALGGAMNYGDLMNVYNDASGNATTQTPTPAPATSFDDRMIYDNLFA